MQSLVGGCPSSLIIKSCKHAVFPWHIIIILTVLLNLAFYVCAMLRAKRVDFNGAYGPDDIL